MYNFGVGTTAEIGLFSHVPNVDCRNEEEHAVVVGSRPMDK